MNPYDILKIVKTIPNLAYLFEHSKIDINPDNSWIIQGSRQINYPESHISSTSYGCIKLEIMIPTIYLKKEQLPSYIPLLEELEQSTDSLMKVIGITPEKGFGVYLIVHLPFGFNNILLNTIAQDISFIKQRILNFSRSSNFGEFLQSKFNDMIENKGGHNSEQPDVGILNLDNLDVPTVPNEYFEQEFLTNNSPEKNIEDNLSEQEKADNLLDDIDQIDKEGESE